MRAIIFIMMSAAALVSCTPDNNEVTGSINDCARKLFTPYNPKNMKQCVAVCIAHSKARADRRKMRAARPRFAKRRPRKVAAPNGQV